MLTVLFACVLSVLAGFIIGYYVCFRRMSETRHSAFWTGFDCGRKDIKADIPAHIDLHRKLWEMEKV